MAGESKWEVVGAKSKKPKQKNGSAKAPKDKKKQDNSFFEASAPICEAQTIYTAFLEKEKKELPPPKQKTSAAEPVKNKDKNVQQKKKKDKKATPSPTKINLEDVYSEVTEDDFKSHLATLELMYPNNPLVWLKDVASFFNVKLDASVEDAVFTGKPLGYPAMLLSKGVYKLMLKTFNRCTPQMLQLFFEHCLQSMVQDTIKGIHTLGYRTVLQCLAQEMPSIATANLQKCLELCTTHQNRQNICLSVMWAAGQAGNKNLEAGFTVWTGLMFPLLGTKTCISYAVDYLENLVGSEDLSKIDKSIISVKDLLHILDFVFAKELVKSIQKRLISCYPTLKDLSYGSEPETALRSYFPSYLIRLHPQAPQAMKEEILSSLVYCLEKDVRNYSTWRQLYSKHFIQSKMLIAHLNEQWEKLPLKFPRSCLFDTLSAFQVTNEELLNGIKKELVVEECSLIIKELLFKINSQKFPWVRVVLIFILIFSLLLTYDILIHDYFIESHTGKLMKDAGLLVICSQAGEKLVYYYGKVYKLLEMYVPSVVSWTQKVIGPYFELFWKQLINSCVYVWDCSSSIRVLCGKYLQPLLLKIDAVAPVYGQWILNVCKNLTVFLQAYLQSIFGYLWSLSETVALWTKSNTVLQNSMEAFLQFVALAVETVQGHAASVLNFMKSYIPS